MGHLVAIKTDMTDLCRRHHRQHRIQHTATGTKDRYESQLSACDLLCGHLRQGSLDLYILQGKVAGRLIAHQHCDLGNQLAKLFGAGVFIAEDRQLMLDQRMIKYRYFTHVNSFFLNHLSQNYRFQYQ